MCFKVEIEGLQCASLDEGRGQMHGGTAFVVVVVEQHLERWELCDLCQKLLGVAHAVDLGGGVVCLLQTSIIVGRVSILRAVGRVSILRAVNILG